MLSIESLTPEQERAVIECIKIFARRGRAIRESKEKRSIAHKFESSLALETASGSPDIIDNLGNEKE